MGCWFSRTAAETKPPPFDVYRNPPLRYIGYAGHVGSACCALLPSNVAHVPQMAATIYMFSDVFQKTMTSNENGDKKKRVVINAVDALLWQLLATAIIPGLVLNGIKSTSKQLFSKQTKGGPCAASAKTISLPRSPMASRLIPCALALLATPYIVGPIDRGVDYILNSTYRKWTAPTEEELMDPKELEKLTKRRAREAERLAQEKIKAAERAEKEKLEKLKQKEKEAKEKAKQKCREEEKARKEKLAAEERALKERLKKEEADLKAKQAKLEQELKSKNSAKMECD